MASVHFCRCITHYAVLDDMIETQIEHPEFLEDKEVDGWYGEMVEYVLDNLPESVLHLDHLLRSTRPTPIQPSLCRGLSTSGVVLELKSLRG